MHLEEMLENLKLQGCFPCISLRGNIWRAHINACGNYWEEADTPEGAMEKAIANWFRGKPMDGLADNGKQGG